MEMAKACLANNTGFGVCLISKGSEVGEAASHEPLGCEAQIKDWDMEQLGILQVRCVGARRFKILSSEVNSSGLVQAEVEYLEEESDLVLPQEFVPLAALAQRIIQDIEKKRSNPAQGLVQEPYDFASASWVSRRLCEFLPIPSSIKHQLMMLNDPVGRLNLVKHFLEQQGVL